MKFKKLIATALSIIFIALLWEFIAWRIGFPALFPPLKQLGSELFLLFTQTDFYVAIAHSVFRGLLGISAAIFIAFILGSLAAFSNFWKNFLLPIVLIFRSVPVISFVLLALLWFSPSQLPLFVALVTVFPITYQAIETALRQTDMRWIEMAKVFAKSPVNRFFSIYLPASKSMIFDGISTAMGFGWRAIIIGEVLAQPLHAIGSSMKEAQAYIQVPKLLAWTVVAIGVSYLFEIILRQIRKIKFKKSLPAPQPFIINRKTELFDKKEINTIELYKYFNNNLIIDHFSQQFSENNIYCIKGVSGKGKTTLLRILAKLDINFRGSVTYGDTNYRLAYSFQDIRLLPWLTVRENIAYVFNKKEISKQELSNRISYLLEKLELTEQADKYPNQLSGGQKQRAGLARALAVQSDILLLDEPLNGLNEELKKQTISFIFEWLNSYKPIVVWATHENIENKNYNIANINI